MEDERSSDDDKTPTSPGIDDDVIAWFTDDFALAAQGIQERARELGHRIRSVGRESCEVERRQLFRMIALLCRMAHIIFSDLDLPSIR